MSRMERYKEVSEFTTRTSKNEKLYDEIYNNKEYNNIEGVAEISNNSEIDIDKLKEMLSKREEKKYRTAKIPVIPKEENVEERREYDINAVLSNARSTSKEDNSHRSLNSVDLDFLKTLDMRENKINEDSKELDDYVESHQTEKINNTDLALDMLSELKPTGDTLLDTDGNFKEKIEQEVSNKPKEIDGSFFTTANIFDKSDFDELDELDGEIKKNRSFIKILVVLLLLTIAIYGSYVLYGLYF